MSGVHVPVIRLTIEGMQHTVAQALVEHATLVNTEIRKQVAKFCSPENIKAVTESLVRNEIERTLKTEIENYFRYGDGQKAIQAAVVRKFKKERT